MASILLPPLGMLLLWKRPGVGLVGKLAGSMLVLLLAVAHLVFVWGLRMEMDGSGMWPIFSFGDRESQYDRVERSRAEQRSRRAPEPESEPEAEPTPEPPSPAPGGTPPATDDKAEAVNDIGTPPMRPKAYWTDYRGPNRDGIYTEGAILTEWPEDGLIELWRQPVGGGYGSFVVAGGMAFTIEQRRDEEVVAAYAMDTGTEVWTNRWKANFQEAMGGPGPRSTPTWHEGRLYALGAEGEFRCLDAATGGVLWSKNILAENGATNLQWAMAASPLIVEEKVIVLPGGPGGKSVVAYDRLTGERIWSALDDSQAYSSPMLATLAGKHQLLVVTGERVVGLAIEDGKLLWEYPWVTSYGVNATQPMVTAENRLFLSAGYGHGSALLEIVPSGDGFEAREIWKTTRMKNKFASAVLYDGNIYGFDEAIFASLDVDTGKLNWKGGRYGYGQVLLAGNHLVITTEQGDVVLVKATPESHQEVARFSAIEGKTWNTPAIDGGLLLVRNTREMACYRIAP